jgi:hypothetical protein
MKRGDFKRWLYRGQRPNWIARMLNRAWAALFSSGLLPDFMVTLEVTGRKSGRTVSLPGEERCSAAAVGRRSTSKRFRAMRAHRS